MSEIEYGQAELTRRLDSIVYEGVISAVDYSKSRVRVVSGGVVTGWLPWLTASAGGDRDWNAPEIDEQVVVLCPSGDPANGLVLGSIFQEKIPQNADVETVRRTTFKDGTVLEYDRKEHYLKIDLKDEQDDAQMRVDLTAKDGAVRILLDANGTLELVAQGGISIKGDITHDGDYLHTGDYNITGDISQSGEITSSGDHVAGSISLQKHVHTGVQSGPSVTGLPI